MMFISCQFLPLLFLCFTPSQAGAEEYELWKQGKQYWYNDQWEMAAKVYQELVDNYPESPRRCKSQNYLGYCFAKMGQKEKAFQTFTKIVKDVACKEETIIDAKSERLQLAFELVKPIPEMKKVLTDGLTDPNLDIRILAAVWLSELGDNSGLEVFFHVLKTEEDLDRRDTAIKHILKTGSELDRERLQKLMNEFKEQSRGAPKMLRLIIRDLNTKEEKLKLNLPISLVNLAIRALSPEQLDLIREQWKIDLRDPNFNLEKMERGKQLFRVVDSSKQEIKLFLE